MQQRTITGPIVDAGGVGVSSGTLRITPLAPAGASGEFVVGQHSFPIASGSVSAVVVVPGTYTFEVLDISGGVLTTFSAAVSDDSLVPVSVSDIWDARLDTSVSVARPLRDGDSVLRLAPGGGRDGNVLSRSGSVLRWAPAPAGDMTAAVYDPGRKLSDAFARVNHTGTQPIASVSGLQDALDAKAPAVHTHDASDITSGVFDPRRLGAGTASAATFLRGDGIWAPLEVIQWTEFYYQLPTGTNGQASVANQWVTLLFNTFGLNEIDVVLDPSGAFTLPLGTYTIDVDAAASKCHENTLRLFDVTDNTLIRVGSTTRPIGTYNMIQTARLKATFTVTTETQFRLDHICYISDAAGYGLATGNLWSDPVPEVYASVFLQRKA